MARRKGVAAPKPAEPVKKESWVLGNLRARHERFKASLEVGHEDVDDSEINAWMNAAIDRIEDLEREAFEMQKRLDEASKTIDDKDTKISDLEEKLEEFDTEVSDAARKVVALVPIVLGREDPVSEPIEAFNLRRAVEDLKTVC